MAEVILANSHLAVKEKTTMTSFPRYLSKSVGKKINIMPKSKSWFMRLCGFGLSITNTLKITNIQDFMTSYYTAIGSTIYGGEDWNMDMKPSYRLMHELTHVMLHFIIGLKYSLLFLVSKSKRAYYESICVQASMMYDGGEWTPEDIEARALHFVPYGIKFEVMIEELADRYEEIKDGKPHPAALRVASEYENWAQESVQEG